MPNKFHGNYWADYMAQEMTPAVRRQEGPPKYDPSQNIDTRTSTIHNSINNNVYRWLQKYPNAMEGQGPDFVTFMGNEGGPVGKGWAKPGVANDPNNKNVNWIPGVKSIMKQQVGKPTFNFMQSKNLAQGQDEAPWTNTA